MERIFITTPSAKSGSTILAWLLAQHDNLSYSMIPEYYELGAMLNVLDWVPEARKINAQKPVKLGSPKMVERIRSFTDQMINPHLHEHCAVKFVDFNSYQWLSYVFPESPILIIVRDPFDWYSSFKEWCHMQGNQTSISWVERRLITSAKSIDKVTDVRIIHYEDLISNPQAVISSVTNWLGWKDFEISTSGQESVYLSHSSRPRESIRSIDSGLILNGTGRGKDLSEEETAYIMKNFIETRWYDVLYGTRFKLPIIGLDHKDA